MSDTQTSLNDNIQIGCGCAACTSNSVSPTSPVNQANDTLDTIEASYGNAIVTGENGKDAVLSGEVWDNGDTTLQLNYNFYTSLPSFYTTGGVATTDEGTFNFAGVSADLRSGFQAMNSHQQQAVNEIMTYVESLIDVNFTKVSDSNDINTAHLSFGQVSRSSENIVAHAFLPNGYFAQGDVFLNTNFWGYDSDPNAGDLVYETILHELGHALGLGHTFDGSDTLSGAEDTNRHSVMSYDSIGINARTFMLYDIAALQELYGANNNYNSGNTTYTLQSGQLYSIWDGGGTDTLDGSALSANLTLYLTEGDYSSVGTTQNIVIAYDAVIENANGGSGNDTIYGNDADNIILGNGGNDDIYGSAGSDTLNGGDGTDEVIYSFDISAFIVSLVNASTLMLEHIANGWTDTLIQIENFTFNAATYTFAEMGQFNTAMGNVTLRFDFEGTNHVHVSGSAGTTTLTADDMGYGGASGDMFSLNRTNENLIINIESASAPGDLNLWGGAGEDNISITGTHAAFEVTWYGYDNNDYLNIVSTISGNDLLVGAGGDDTINSSGGNDTIYGGDGNDTINGGDGDDLIYGDNKLRNATETGDDILNGGDGNDTILAGYGADRVNGGNDNDIIAGDDGEDVLYGDAGDDTIYGGNDADEIYGDNKTRTGVVGHDKIYGGNGADTLMGGDGNDQIWGDADADIIAGDAGTDTLYGGDGGDTMYGGNDNDSMFGDAGNDTMQGDAGNDYMSGGNDNDIMYGDNVARTGVIGNDTMYGDAGGDTIYGGDGDDTIYGDNNTRSGVIGADILYGDAGNDTIMGGDGDDQIWGGDGNDTLAGDGGADTLNGDDGRDIIYGGVGAYTDTLNGGEGDDVLYGDGKTETVNDGDDILNGGEGVDWLIAGGGNDQLDGGAGNDRLWGGSGDDTLIGGAGIDIIYGGAGTDLIDYSGESAGVTVSLADYYGFDGGGSRDSLGEIENVDGSDHRDTIVGNDQTNVINGNGDNDVLYGHFGDDTVNGGDGNDLIYGDIKDAHANDGNDILNGGAGNDTLIGRGGDDILNGGDGTDVLWGGTGADTFVLDLFGGVDIIRDWNTGEGDILDFSDILDGFYTNPAGQAIEDFIQITDNGGNTSVYVDQNGGGNSWTQVAIIYSTTGLTDEAALEGAGTLITI